jgi:hypothetical protein
MLEVGEGLESVIEDDDVAGIHNVVFFCLENGIHIWDLRRVKE